MTLVNLTGRAIAAISLAATLGVATGCSDKPEQVAVPGSSKASKLTQCVRPTAFMRRNHFELIKHQRDVTVHQGMRATSDSLSACIACHVQYDAKHQPIPVNAEDQFCDGCHEWLAVQPDCFECHATVPTGPQPSNLNTQWPTVFPPSPLVGGKPAAKAKPAPAAKAVVVTPAAQAKPGTAPVKPAVATPVPAVQVKPVPTAKPVVATPVPAVSAKPAPAANPAVAIPATPVPAVPAKPTAPAKSVAAIPAPAPQATPTAPAKPVDVTPTAPTVPTTVIGGGH